MREDQEFREFRDLMKPPEQYAEGFGWGTVLMALFVGLVMAPCQLYISMVAGIGLGPAANWVTVILYVEIARRAFKKLRRPEIFVLFYMCGAMMATGSQGLIWRQFVVQSEAMRKKVIKAMIYPTMVTLTAIAVTIMMLVFVIPQFAGIFSSLAPKLPWFTRQVIKSSDFMLGYGPYLAAALSGGMLLCCYSYKKSRGFRLALHKFNLRLPIIGNVILKATVARFSRTLATTFSAGIPLLTGLQSAGKTAGNLYIEQAIEEAYTSTAAGMPLHIALRQSDVFPELMLQMTMIPLLSQSSVT